MMDRLAALSSKLASALPRIELLRMFQVRLAENVSLKDIVVIATTPLEGPAST